jgi:membrane protein DedA with SNARE-associated domain
MESLIGQLGYAAVFIGTFLEGETVLALAGVAAAHGHLSLPMVIAVAMAGAFLGDQCCFYVGRRYGPRVLARFPAIAARAPRVQELLRRWDAPAVILLRFMYGLRIAGPIIIASCGISPWRLALFNFIGVLIWAPLVAGLGYFAGQALAAWLGRLQGAQIMVVIGAALVATVAWIIILWSRRKDG